MDQYPQMLYRAGGPEQIHGGQFFTLVVQDEAEHAEAIAQGWFETTPAALDALKPEADKAPTPDAPPAAPTRAELEQKATELGIDFDGRWGDKRLTAAIAAKLAEAGT